jgi:16S rRNA (uracil1498-N3)-methyltransferase
LLIGPEGGFTTDEANVAVQAGFIPVLLGPRVLRTETAAIAGIAALQTLWGDFQ